LRRLQPLQMVKEALRSAPKNPFARVATLESSLYMRNQLLRDTDWASMAHALEVRVPLVDHVLLRQVAPFVGTLPEGAAKRMLAAAPAGGLPAAIVDRPKTGFTTPIESWMQAHMAASVSSARKDPSLRHWARRWSCEVGALALARA